MGSRQLVGWCCRSVVAALSVLAVACSGGDPGATKNCGVDGTSCRAAEDCGGAPCTDGCCEAAQTCTVTSDCPTGQGCDGGICKPASENTACTSSKQCEDRSIDTPACDFTTGACVACLTNNDCKPSGTKICKEKKCEAKPGGCGRDADCAQSPIGGKCDTVTRACVECLTKVDCLVGTNVCVANKCVIPNQDCTNNEACSSPTAYCDTSKSRCVGCLDNGQCNAGEKCENSTCVPAACSSNANCAGNPNGSKCDTGTGICVECLATPDCGDPTLVCTNKECVPAPTGCTRNQDCTGALAYCDLATGDCVECDGTQGCGVGSRCQAGTCVPVVVPTGCQSDSECAAGTARKCALTGANAGRCVVCLAGADCGSGRCAADGTCLPGCAADANCAAPTPKCELTSNACVGCLANADCATGSVCSGNVCLAGCSGDGDCASSPIGKKCVTATRTCVACTADADCGAGKRCDQNQCVGITPVDGDPPCGANDVCAAGSTCRTEGTAKICRKSCAPYAPGATCATGKVCQLIGFTATGTTAGACVPRNGRGVPGVVCQGSADCEKDLLCLPSGANENKCAKLCAPGSTTSCGTGEKCASIPAIYDDTAAAMRNFGACLPTANEYGKTCSSDFSTNNAGGTRPDCPTGMTCGPNNPWFDPFIRVSTCQFPVGTGEVTTACTPPTTGALNPACKTGDCLRGPNVCNTSCRWTSDCARAAPTGSFKCLPYTWYAYEASTDTLGTSSTGACQPVCSSDAACSTGNYCALTPTFENSGRYLSSFYAACRPFEGSATVANPNRKSGARCTADNQCASGYCETNGRAGATDGYCFGTCDKSSATACDPTRGVVCDPSGVGLKLNNGVDGISGTADDAYGQAFVCSGERCDRDSDCTGDSADATKPRACTLTYQVNGANSRYATTTSELRLTCEPQVGAGKAGASCVSDGDCASGACFTFDNNKKACFGGCVVNSDCASRASCASVDFDGNLFDVCAPN